MKNIINVAQVVFAAIGGFLGYMLGGWVELSRKVQSVNPQIFKNRPLRFSEPEVVTPILQPVSHRRRRLGFDGLSEKCYHCRTGG